MKIDKFLLKGYPSGDTPQKRFLVSFSNLDILKKLPDCQVVEITDCQESTTEDFEVRTRMVSTLGKEQYFKSERDVDFGKILKERETAITEEEFKKSTENMYHLYKLVHRTRYAFCNGLISSGKLAGITFEDETGRGMFMMLDTFDFWNGFAILTVRGSGVKDIENLQLPGTLNIVKEVTRDKTFTTKVLSTIDYTSFLE